MFSIGSKVDNSQPTIQTLMTGCPIAHNKNSLTAGQLGPVSLQDRVLLEKVTQFDREQIPPRNVHALGFGHYGTFTLTNDISEYSMAKIFQKKSGATTDVFVRFSGVFTQAGEADTVRDLRGFACKFYTDEGNWDLLCTNTPVFAVRDMKSGPDAVHAFKRDPRSDTWNPSSTWDFVATHPEGYHNLLMIYTDKVGTPASMRYQHYWPCNTYSFINKDMKRVWIRFHLISELGSKGLTLEQAKMVAGEDPDFLTRDMWNAIEQGEFPRWKLCFQTMREEEGYQFPFAFDCTKIWPINQFPLIEIGTIEVNRNPVNFHAEVEQVAFSPANVIPGIGFSPDRLLQGRLLVYDDTQHHRLGPNFKQYPTNYPRCAMANTNYIGGQAQWDTKNKFPHYYPSLFGSLLPTTNGYVEPPMQVTGPVDFYDFPGEGSDFDYYEQPRSFLTTLTPEEFANLVENIAYSLSKVDTRIVEATLNHFSKIDQKLYEQVQKSLTDRKQGLRKTKAEMFVEELRQSLLPINPKKQ